MKINKLLIVLTFNALAIISCHSNKEISKIEKPTINSYTDEKDTNKEIIPTLNTLTLSRQVRTLICHQLQDPLSQPIINLDSDDKLRISFDDLDADIKNYYYTIIHCNVDWTRSDLIESEYIQGFYEEYIKDHEFSYNTIQRYTHYSFEFPSKTMKPLLSGNYVFKIFEEGKDPIAYQRFMVLDTKTSIEPTIKRATLAKYRNIKHEIDFIIKTPELETSNPYSEIQVVVTQNNRLDNSLTELKPVFIKNDELVYDYEDQNIFLGNNEFRHFDTKSLRYHSERIKSIYFDSIYNHVYLYNDQQRTFNQYSIISDINGKFLIQSQEGWDSKIEADYAFVHFTLPFENISYGNVFLLGSFSRWQLDDDFKMIYNTNKKQYEASVFLKQGYYNYNYALNDTITKCVDASYIEGSHYQTRNDYYIYVYFRNTGEIYDQLVGFKKSSSKQLF